MVTITRIDSLVVDTIINILGIHMSHIIHHDDCTCDISFYLGRSWMMCCKNMGIELVDANNLNKKITIGCEVFNEVYFS